MIMKKDYTFDRFLRDEFGESEYAQGVLDDDLPDVLDNWVGGLDGQEVIELAERYGAKMIEEGRLSVLRDFDNAMYADHFVGFTEEEWAAVKKFFEMNKSISGWDK